MYRFNPDQYQEVELGTKESFEKRDSFFNFMFMAKVYVIYSKQIDKFYIGVTNGEIETRVESHKKSKYGGKSYTSQANDWELKFAIEAVDYSHAVRIERKIKSMKSRKYIESLINSEENIEKLIHQTWNT
ncbi:MAG: GIY-YIG nuclease family protein [Saprospiraceae bacterium]|nr:GIY-YIG nuclease family protein [Saprospiraceae bacterium]